MVGNAVAMEGVIFIGRSDAADAVAPLYV